MSFASKPFNGNRKATSQKYGLKKTTSTRLPAPKADLDPIIEERKPPSYAYVDTQTGEVDKESEDKGKFDEEIREDQGKNPKETQEPGKTFKPKSRIVKTNDRHDQPSTESTLGSNVFETFWSPETSHVLEEVTYTEKNSWVPNAYAMFEILDAASSFVTGSKVMEKHHPEYLDYGVACYYSILFYIQILRAQRHAGALTGENHSLLKRFEFKFAPESLPVAEMLEPFFSSITSTLLPDSKYSWIIPTFAPGIFHNNMRTILAVAHDATTVAHGGMFLQPMVPYMLSILREAITQDRSDHLFDNMQQKYGGAENGVAPAYFNDEDEYIPFRLSDAVDATLWGNTFRGTVQKDDLRNAIFHASGVSYPFHADQGGMRNAATKWRRSTFNSLAAANLIDGTRAINSLEFFLHMEKADDLEWFEQLKSMAIIHARFFKGVKNLSDIPCSGGMETLITCRYMKKAADGTAINYAAPINVGGRTIAGNTSGAVWYPRTFRVMEGSFFTTRNGIKRQEELQALTFGVNGSIFVGAVPNTVGEDTVHYRKGPYWLNKEWTFTKFQGTAPTGKKMFSGWKTLIQSSFQNVKPDGY